MSDSTHDLLVRGIAAAKGNSREEARFYLEWVLRAPDAEQSEMAEAWRNLADITDDPVEKRKCLEEVLARNPMDPEARRNLAILKGDLKPEDIIDPDKVPAPVVPALPQPAQARRFVCMNCGGKMEFAPDGNALVCAYCGRKQSVISAIDDGAMVPEQDFGVALATAKGHSTPVATQSLKCQGCGASFALPAQILSGACPYCASPYVVEQSETRTLIPPEGILPFTVSRDQAQRAVMDWYRTQGYTVKAVNALPSGVYLPVWTFDVGGVVTWNCRVEQSEVWVPISGSELVYEKDQPVAASHTLSAILTDEITAFPFDKMVAYDASYLADLPAETYQITVSDASLVARSRILAKIRPRIEAGITESFRDVVLSATQMVFETFKLVLVPMWIARYRYERTWYNVAVNGQTAAVRGERLRKSDSGWLSSLGGRS